MCDSGVCEDKPPAPPVRMSSQGGGPKDSQSANHSSRPLPSVPEERKPRNKIISMFASEKGGTPARTRTQCKNLRVLSVGDRHLDLFLQEGGRKTGTRTGLRSPPPLTLSTPSMWDLMLSLESSLYVSDLPSSCTL